jgi:GTPase SAR1 family protein
VRAQKNTNRYKICSGEDFTFTGLFIATSKEKVVELNAGTKESKYEYKRWFEDEFYLGDEIVFLSTQWYNDSEDSTLKNKQLRYSELQKLLDTCYSGLYKCNYEVINDRNDMPKATTQQVIYFGAPGTGKSHLVKKLLKDKYGIDEKKKTGIDRLFRTTFHPDTDYSSFVGCYRPTIDKKSGNITYEFNEEVFTKAYIQAWAEYKRNPSNPAPVFLIIEEINRGNCAQIFGDLFQLLDRNDDGFSEYKIKADNALTEHLKNKAPNSLQDDNLCLPPNLNIIATMNTSDQSLFPMDSAFKRRWDWQCIPTIVPNDCKKILKYDVGNGVQDFEKKDIDAGDYRYSWKEFLENINVMIESATKSDDKKLGYWFIKTPKGNDSISISDFVSKVVFYLWNDVFKDVGAKDCNPFAIKGTKAVMTYSKFFEMNASTGQIVENIGVLHTFMKNVDVTPTHISSTQNP